MSQTMQQYEAARKANEQRYAQAMAIYDEIINRYQPGGTFGQAALGLLEEQKTRDIGKEMQQMISSGIYGTTTAAGAPRRWEAEVGAPSRLRLEDIMMQRLSGAQVGKAGFIERREDVYPDVGAVAGYAGQMAQAEATKYAAETGARSQQKMQQEQLAQQDWMQHQQAHEAKMAAWRAGGTQKTTTPTTTALPAGSPQALWEAGKWEGNRPLSEIMSGVTTEEAPPTPQQVGMTGAMGSLPGQQKPYMEGFNYSAYLYNKTGKILSQQAAYAELKGAGPVG